MKKNKFKLKKIKLIENYLDNYLQLESLLKNLRIQKNDKIILSSRLILIINNVYSNNLHLNIDIDKISNIICDYIIRSIIKVIGKNGTLLIPTYNWDFCKGKIFDYYNTPSSAGEIGNYSLGNKKFKRTMNPIYSFAVTGKDKNFICKLPHKSCFGENSPFSYLIKKNGKNLFIGFKDYREGFNFPYVAEEKVGVKHRFFKTFIGHYKKGRNINKKEVSMYVRDLDKKKITLVTQKFKKYLIKDNSLLEIKKKNIIFTVINLKKTFKHMIKDLNSKKIFITTKNN